MKNKFRKFKYKQNGKKFKIKIEKLYIIIFVIIVPFIIDNALAAEKQINKKVNVLPDICNYTADTYFKDKQIFTVLETIEETQNKNEAYKKLYKYYKIVGRDMIHMHHYCRGFKKYQEAFSIGCNTEQCRKDKISGAIGEIEYVLKKSSKTLVVRPMLLHTQGQWYLQINEPMKAMNVFMKAVQTDPKYVNGYLSLYSLFLSLNDEALARNILKIGLEHSPSSKALLNLKNRSHHP